MDGWLARVGQPLLPFFPLLDGRRANHLPASILPTCPGLTLPSVTQMHPGSRNIYFETERSLAIPQIHLVAIRVHLNDVWSVFLLRPLKYACSRSFPSCRLGVGWLHCLKEFSGYMHRGDLRLCKTSSQAKMHAVRCM